MGMLRFLLVLALVFGLATPATAEAVTPRLRGEDPVAPLPTDRTPVGDLTGRWVPTDDVGDWPAYVDFAADGTWTGSDGCTPTGGSWLAGPDGAFLATARTLMTFVACPGVGVAPLVGAARRIGTDGTTVVFLDADGAPVGHFRRA